MSELFAKVYEELKIVPITMLFMGGLYGLVGYLIHDHVSKQDFVELKSQLSGVQLTLQKDHADTRLHAIEQEIFDLSQHVADEKSKGHVVDELYERRIQELNSQHAEVIRQQEVLRQIEILNRSQVP